MATSVAERTILCSKSSLPTHYIKRRIVVLHCNIIPIGTVECRSTERFKAIGEAYGELSDPAQRARYDASLKDPFSSTASTVATGTTLS
jgi:hypothetical protein